MRPTSKLKNPPPTQLSVEGPHFDPRRTPRKGSPVNTRGRLRVYLVEQRLVSVLVN
jgi:hypothetical protein